MRADLQYWRDIWFWGLAASGVVVLIGVACEYAEVKNEFIKWLSTHLWHRTFFPKYFVTRHKQTWIPFWAAVGLAVIAVGLAGEIICEVFVFNADNQLSVFEGRVMDEARRETAAAFERAAIAEREANSFKSQIAQANARAAEANRISESEKLARVELEKQLQARRLTGKQKERLRSLLSDNPQQIMFGWCMTGSDDCQDLVNDIGESFNKAGWKTTFGNSTRNKRGIQVGFMKGSDERLVAMWVPKIRNALSEAGLASEQEWFEPNDKWLVGGFEKNVLYVIIGRKPDITDKSR